MSCEKIDFVTSQIAASPALRPGAAHGPAIVRMRRQHNGAFSLQISDLRVDQDPELLRILPANVTVRAETRDGAGLSLEIQFLAQPGQDAEAPDRRTPPGLPKWRLKRAFDHIEANLAEPISLPDLAEVAGLSPTYFSTQFRATTGLRPHEYILRRRIHHAQRMLLDPRTSVIEIALSVGFQTHAHFTTVFKRFVGETPYRWRQRNLEAPEPAVRLGAA
ncbi:hypothetical protein GCM10011611_07970 [Aliidongia dinghuensis]|uniref:HTH araC/xylS-type domain-containing protein n=2 Tax=Aliidongia dinghuensis TaxID=1867774 RepID=A0A8J3E1T3_9PROT|nr:hypothetical protein GCM10011611_07970 [Aliidongia dinghuensis]